MSEAIAIIRLRGRVGVNYDIEHTLKLLKLNCPNHAVLYPANDSIKGMLNLIKDQVTYGEVNASTIEHLLRKRGELIGKKKLTDSYVKKNTNYSTIKQLAKAIANGEALIKDLPNFKPVFRLSPPRKGFKSLKKPIGRKGDLGYRGEAINDLIARMA